MQVCLCLAKSCTLTIEDPIVNSPAERAAVLNEWKKQHVIPFMLRRAAKLHAQASPDEEVVEEAEENEDEEASEEVEDEEEAREDVEHGGDDEGMEEAEDNEEEEEEEEGGGAQATSSSWDGSDSDRPKPKKSKILKIKEEVSMMNSMNW